MVGMGGVAQQGSALVHLSRGGPHGIPASVEPLFRGGMQSHTGGGDEVREDPPPHREGVQVERAETMMEPVPQTGQKGHREEGRLLEPFCLPICTQAWQWWERWGKKYIH